MRDFQYDWSCLDNNIQTAKGDQAATEDQQVLVLDNHEDASDHEEEASVEVEEKEVVGNIIRRSKIVKIVHLSTESLLPSLNKLTASNRLHLRVDP